MIAAASSDHGNPAEQTIDAGQHLPGDPVRPALPGAGYVTGLTPPRRAVEPKWPGRRS